MCRGELSQANQTQRSPIVRFSAGRGAASFAVGSHAARLDSYSLAGPIDLRLCERSAHCISEHHLPLHAVRQRLAFRSLNRTLAYGTGKQSLMSAVHALTFVQDCDQRELRRWTSYELRVCTADCCSWRAHGLCSRDARPMATSCLHKRAAVAPVRPTHNVRGFVHAGRGVRAERPLRSSNMIECSIPKWRPRANEDDAEVTLM